MERVVGVEAHECLVGCGDGTSTRCAGNSGGKRKRGRCNATHSETSSQSHFGCPCISPNVGRQSCDACPPGNASVDACPPGAAGYLLSREGAWQRLAFAARSPPPLKPTRQGLTDAHLWLGSEYLES